VKVGEKDWESDGIWFERSRIGEGNKRAHGESTKKRLEADNIFACRPSTSPRMCMSDLGARYERPKQTMDQYTELMLQDSVQVNIPAESGEMGILANHVPAIEQLKPGLVEIIEEAGASKQYFRTSNPVYP
jgi:hypothetical protein